MIARIVMLSMLLLMAGAQAQEPSFSVQFKITPTSSESGYAAWLASYEEKGKTAKFIIEIQKPSPSMEKFSIDKGIIRHVVGSQSQYLMERLSVALGAKGKGLVAKKVNRLPIELAVLGIKQSRLSPNSGFASKPGGDWIAMKAFLAQGEGEVYLNLNPEKGIGEFSIKDEEYADIVLRELGSVL